MKDDKPHRIAYFLVFSGFMTISVIALIRPSWRFWTIVLYMIIFWNEALWQFIERKKEK